MENPAFKPKVVAYARTSKVLGQDPQLQIEAIREFAKGRGFTLIAEHVDQVTGDKERRPGLDALIADCKMGRVNIVVVAALDRMFRSTKHMLNLVDELRHYGVSIISLREQLDFTTPTGLMTLTVLAAVATLEKQIISERIRTSLAVKKITAERTGSGWRCGRKLVATEDRIKRVLELRGQGLSVREIERSLNKEISRGSIQRILDANKDCPNNVSSKIGKKAAMAYLNANDDNFEADKIGDQPVSDGTPEAAQPRKRKRLGFPDDHS